MFPVYPHMRSNFLLSFGSWKPLITYHSIVATDQFCGIVKEHTLLMLLSWRSSTNAAKISLTVIFNDKEDPNTTQLVTSGL